MPPGTPLIFASAPTKVILTGIPGSPIVPLTESISCVTRTTVIPPTSVVSPSVSVSTTTVKVEDEEVLECGSI